MSLSNLSCVPGHGVEGGLSPLGALDCGLPELLELLQILVEVDGGLGGRVGRLDQVLEGLGHVDVRRLLHGHGQEVGHGGCVADD